MAQEDLTEIQTKSPRRTSSTRSSDQKSSQDSSGKNNSSENSETVVDESSSKTYVIGKFLGKGAHARVYEATDVTKPHQVYAIKLMAIEVNLPRQIRHYNGVKEVRMTQVLKEVEIHALMHHVNIVKLESFFQQHVRFCILLEYCAGNTLAQLLDNIGHMGETSSRNLLNQLVDGVEHIHSLGVIHRDLKPANIYLTRDMVIKIGDFGLADRVGSGRKGICGTPNYISPEALLEQGYTPAADIWALGCIAYHMLAGRPPFDAPSQTTTYELIRNHRYCALTSSQAGAGARNLVHWMLSFLPEERPSISFIRGHAWMKRQPRKRDSAKRLRQRTRSRKSAPIAQKLDEISTSSSNNSSDSMIAADNGESIKYERLCEKVSDVSLGNGVDDNSKSQPFWKNLLERVKLKKTPSFQLLSSTLLNISNKVVIRISGKQSNLKRLLEQILKMVPSKQSAGSGCDVKGQELPIFVAKWIDYSNKFGFGYQMTDGTTGVIFNDHTQICLDGNITSLTYITPSEKVAYPVHNTPAFLTTRLTLLENFKEYMDTQLSCGLPIKHVQTYNGKPTIVKEWYRCERAVVFYRKNLIQVNFANEHIKLLLYVDKYLKTYNVTTIDDEKNMKKYALMDFKENGCPDFLFPHLNYIHSIL